MSTLSFTAPWLLAALALLPVIWWILRVTPPAPRRLAFPAIAFLLGPERRDETPAHTPLWLLILRMLIAALIIIGLAGPMLGARKASSGAGPLLIAIDDGWPSAANWEAIRAAGLDLADEAARGNKPVILLRTAPGPAQSLGAVAPARAKSLLQAMLPQPWRPDRKAALETLKAAKLSHAPGRVVWLSDGVGGADGADFSKALAAIAKLDVLAPDERELPIALRPARATNAGLDLELVRVATERRQTGTLSAYGASGKLMERESFAFEPGRAATTVALASPTQVRNQILRIEIDGARSAGAVTLLDDRWRRRSVGLVSGGPIESEQPLLSELYYVERALQPIADLRKGEVSALLDGPVSVLVLADVGRLREDEVDKLTPWIEGGGVLVRFAGPRLAAQTDELVPVTLREGGRALGGTLSWEEPQALGAFDEASPFAGLTVAKDVTVRRQVLAEPGIELASRTWARLADGTPLVTAVTRGKGRIVLFHVTANADWSNLPLSGLFVDMLERIAALADTAGAAQGASAEAVTLAPRRALDGFGALKPAPATATPIPAADIKSARPTPAHPPGYYGPAEHPLALNTTNAAETLPALGEIPASADLKFYARDRVMRVGPPLLAAALLLGLLDGLIALLLMGKLSALRFVRPREGAAAALILVLALLPADRLRADDAFLLKGALDTRLAYAITGNQSVDEMSRAGLDGLTRALTAKTALEPGAPIGLDMEKDELSLFPLIYWPVTANQKAPSLQTQAKLDRYLKTGGMILFDTRDADEAAAVPGTATAATLALRRILSGLDIPPLTPVPQGHVLTRSFYLLNQFPGRFASGGIWVEAPFQDASGDAAHEGTVNDGVSSVIIGGNDWASAWAVDTYGRPVAALIPGGERQRELSIRFGVNLAMYALTGNYKGDEVHTREILKRLGE